MVYIPYIFISPIVLVPYILYAHMYSSVGGQDMIRPYISIAAALYVAVDTFPSKSEWPAIFLIRFLHYSSCYNNQQIGPICIRLTIFAGLRTFFSPYTFGDYTAGLLIILSRDRSVGLKGFETRTWTYLPLHTGVFRYHWEKGERL